MTDFVAPSGTRHRLANPNYTLIMFAECSDRIWVNTNDPVRQQPVRDCKRCFPKGDGE